MSNWHDIQHRNRPMHNLPQKCPLEVNNRCYPCANNTYYNNDNNTCLSCWLNSLYNPITGKCECVDGYHYNASTKTCTGCPSDQFYNTTTNKCQGCGFNQVLYQGKCYYCPDDTYYDAGKHTCMKCHAGYVLNQVNKTCVSKCTGGTVYINATGECKCPEDKIHWDGSMCLSCALPRYWDAIKSACLQCPTGQFFNASLKKCDSCQPGYAFDSSTYTCTRVCLGDTQYSATTQSCVPS